MVIHRIREHAGTHNWFAVAIDLAIVVVGVVIATQVSNWNQERIDRDTATSYRQRLVRELEFNSLQFRQQADYYNDAKRHGVAALAALEGRDRSLSEQSLVDAYQATQIDPTPPKRFIFNEMQSAGLVRLLGPESLQEMTSDYYLSLDANIPQMLETPPYREILRRSMPYPVQVRIRERCGDQFVYRGKQVIGTRLPADCSLGLTVAQVTQAVRQLRAVPQLQADLTRYLSALEQKVGLLRGTAKQTDDLRAALMSEAR